MADEAPAPGTRTIPIDWNGTRPGKPEPEKLVVMPNVDQQLAYAEAHRHTTCGTCAKFNLTAGQLQMKKERFLERLVLEEQWKTKHLGAPVNTMGMCGEHNGDLLTSAFARGCEHHRPRNGRVGKR